MVASLLRSLNSGIQDGRVLSRKGEPQIQMFMKAFVRAGRFTTQFVRLDFDTKPSLGTACSITLPRKGHLLSRLYLVTTLPDIATPQINAKAAADASGVKFLGPTFGWTNSLGHALINQAEITIGGSRCERLDGRLLEVLDEFYTPMEKVTLMNAILPRLDNGFKPGSIGSSGVTVATTPLPFWFSCGDSGAYLPIDAIQADQVLLKIQFNPLASIYVSSDQQTPTLLTASVGGDAYVPLLGSPFYYNGPGGQTPLQGVSMPALLPLGDTYIMAEYIYLDKPEANRFRIADIQIPIPQHYPFDPYDTRGVPRAQVQLKIPNPTRNLFFYLQRWEATRYNAPFLATRDLSRGGSIPWWPDASGLNTYGLGQYSPGFCTRESEPIGSLALTYEGSLTRFWTDSPSLFRSFIPSLEMKKAPWVNRYFYVMPFGFQNGLTPPSLPSGEANLDKLLNIELSLQLQPNRGSINPNDVPRFFVHVWAETYNVLRIFGGRAGLLFGY